jgi:hypothetical protein
MSDYPTPMFGEFPDDSKKYRLRDGSIGTYAEACRECLDYWHRKKLEAEKRIEHFENELKDKGST